MEIAMGYLDELRKKADEVKNRQGEDQKREQQLRDIFEREVLPKMQTLFLYMYEMVNNLRILKPDIAMVYKIPGVGALEYRQTDYILSKEDEIRQSFFLRVESSLEKKPSVERTTLESAESLRHYLIRNNILFDYTQMNDKQERFYRGVFILDQHIYGEFRFEPELENSCIKMTVRNYGGLGRKTYIFSPPEITDGFLDNLARYITRDISDTQFLDYYEEEKVLRRRQMTPQAVMREKIRLELIQQHAAELLAKTSFSGKKP
jgi:hypothetical protein